MSGSIVSETSGLARRRRVAAEIGFMVEEAIKHLQNLVRPLWDGVQRKLHTFRETELYQQDLALEECLKAIQQEPDLPLCPLKDLEKKVDELSAERAVPARPAASGSGMDRPSSSQMAETGREVAIVQGASANVSDRPSSSQAVVAVFPSSRSSPALRRSKPCQSQRPCSTCRNGLRDRCITENTVYKITCKVCSEFYIGESAQNVRSRYALHVSNARSRKQFTPLGDHVRDRHTAAETTPEFAVEILHTFESGADRRKKKRKLIENLDPKINITRGRPKPTD